MVLLSSEGHRLLRKRGSAEQTAGKQKKNFFHRVIIWDTKDTKKAYLCIPRIFNTMKHSFKIILGVLLIIVGVIWILNLAGVPGFDFSTRGWWTLFIILPCLASLLHGKEIVGPCIGIGVGVLLLLADRGVIDWGAMWQYALALLIVGFGVRLLFFKSCCGRQVKEFKTVSRDGKDIRRIESAFGKQSLSFAGEKFDGADVHVSFGGLTLDLRGAEIAKEAVIDLSVAFSGIVIIVPEGTAVVTAVSNGFGGVSDKRFSKINTGEPTLVLTGDIGFGGVELRN